MAGNALSSSVACEVLLGAYTQADATVSAGEKADDLQGAAALRMGVSRPRRHRAQPATQLGAGRQLETIVQELARGCRSRFFLFLNSLC